MTHSIELLCPCGASMKSSGYSYPSDVRKLVEHFNTVHAECYARSEGTLSLDSFDDVTLSGERLSFDPPEFDVTNSRPPIKVRPPVYEYVEGGPRSRASLADRLLRRHKDGIILAPESALTAGADLKAGDPVAISEDGLVVHGCMSLDCEPCTTPAPCDGPSTERAGRAETHDCPGSYDCRVCYPGDPTRISYPSDPSDVSGASE